MKFVVRVLLLMAALLCTACGVAPRASGAAVTVDSIPFRDGERLLYSLHDATGAAVGRGILSVGRAGAGLQLEQVYGPVVASGADQLTTDQSTVTTDASTLRPRAMQRTATAGSSINSYVATYTEDARAVDLVRNDGKPRTVKLPEHAYDNESSLWLWRSLPLADGYAGRYVSMNAVEGSVQTVEVAVTSRQQIEVPAGKFDTWRLQVRNGRATRVAWINAQAPHEVVQWDNGSLVFSLEPPQ